MPNTKDNTEFLPTTDKQLLACTVDSLTSSKQTNNENISGWHSRPLSNNMCIFGAKIAIKSNQTNSEQSNDYNHSISHENLLNSLNTEGASTYHSLMKIAR